MSFTAELGTPDSMPGNIALAWTVVTGESTGGTPPVSTASAPAPQAVATNPTPPPPTPQPRS